MGASLEPQGLGVDTSGDNESRRLAALRRYDILDTPPDGAFDRVTAVAARVFAVPIAIVSLVDEDRIWFKSHHGLEGDQVPRDAGLCASAILADDVYAVTDAGIDVRTLANPLVAGELGLRFYAAAPLRTEDGYRLGTLCVIDRVPREVTGDEMALLEDLAAIVMGEMELRRSAQEAVRNERLRRRERQEAVQNERLLKREQVELTSENEQLREVDALKDQFVSVVSHELRTPLTAIRGYLEIVLGEEPGALNQEQRRYLKIIDFSSEQLLRVVDDLLLIGKVGAGHLELEIGEVDLALMLEECIVAALPAANAKGIGLRLAVARVAPIEGDRGRLAQAVGNIMANAIKFTKDGHVDVRLDVETDRVVIEIIDTGVGVPASEIGHLFVPFFRASTATRQAIPGTGLGLSIAKEIIAAHGGDISVESTVGSGMSVRVELPRTAR